MAGISFQSIRVPQSQGAVLRYKQQKAAVTTLKIRNEGANDLNLKLQDSEDGASFSDIGGATKTVKAGGRGDLTVVPNKPYLQIVAGGDTYMKLDIAYEGLFLEGNIDLLVFSESDGQGWPVQPQY